MSVFDENNIKKEHPIDKAYDYVKEVIELHFYNIINDTCWNSNRAAQIFNNMFKRKSEFFEGLGFHHPYVCIESYSMQHWNVRVYICNTSIVDDLCGPNTILLYSEYPERHWDDVQNLNIEITEFKENL